MFDSEKIKSIYQKAVEKQWPFHYVFNSLKSIGIDRVETNVLTHEIKYVGDGASLTESPPENFAPLAAGPVFDLDALKAAIAKMKKEKSHIFHS